MRRCQPLYFPSYTHIHTGVCTCMYKTITAKRYTKKVNKKRTHTRAGARAHNKEGKFARGKRLRRFSPRRPIKRRFPFLSFFYHILTLTRLIFRPGFFSPRFYCFRGGAYTYLCPQSFIAVLQQPERVLFCAYSLYTHNIINAAGHRTQYNNFNKIYNKQPLLHIYFIHGFCTTSLTYIL